VIPQSEKGRGELMIKILKIDKCPIFCQSTEYYCKKINEFLKLFDKLCCGEFKGTNGITSNYQSNGIILEKNNIRNTTHKPTFYLDLSKEAIY
jgi:hypothetical protein